MQGLVDRTAEETLTMLLENAVRTESGCLICHLAPTQKGYTRKVGKELLAKILEMRAQGASHSQIAVMFDLSKTCIATNLRRAKNVASE
jgi:hypothetical protein